MSHTAATGASRTSAGSGPDTGEPLALGSKAETLAQLTPILRTGRVLPLLFFTVEQWLSHPERVLEDIATQDWSNTALIVRSSTHAEDDPSTMMPGSYLSVGGVQGPEALRGAVEAVIGSYRDRPDEPAAQELSKQRLVNDDETWPTACPSCWASGWATTASATTGSTSPCSDSKENCRNWRLRWS